MAPEGTPKLGDMPAEEFRKYGHTLVDRMADFLKDIDNYPVFPAVRPGDVRGMLPTAPPQSGESMEDILSDVDRVVMPGMAHWSHPRFMAYFNSSGSAPGILAEVLCATFNANGMVWQSCPSATEVEQVMLGWLRQMLGLPEKYWGIIYDTASVSTLHALAAAREHLSDLHIRDRGMTGRTDLPRLRVYASEYVHSSVDKAVIALGFGIEGIRKISVDQSFQMIPAALAEAINEDRRNGVRPFCVVATVGTTSCTSIDPVREIAALCGREGIWLHIDAAHGGAAALVPEYRYVLDGCELADSIVVNPHKWMFVPMDLSVLFTRKPEMLRRAFSLVPEYLRTPHDEVVENYMDYGIPLGRRFRALKLWFVFRYFGTEGLANRIREHIRVANEFADWIDAHREFERLAPVPLSTVLFRAHPSGTDDEETLNALNERLMKAVNESGRAFLSHTRLGNRYAIRLVVSGLRTLEPHVQEVWKLLQQQLSLL